MDTANKDIAALVNKALEGDESSYRMLYLKYAKGMYNVCLRLLNNKEDAEDVVQESFITAFKNLKQLKEAATFGGWLRRIITNNCLQHIKGKVSFEELGSFDEVDDDFNWMDKIPYAEVHNAIKNLPDGCRQIFLLYTSEDYMHKEIAELLGVSESTSKSQYLRAKKLLQQQLRNG